MSFPDDIITLFVDAGLGTASVNLVIGQRAVISSTLTSLAVIPTGGLAPEGTHNLTDVPAYVKPSAQIVCYAPTYALAEAQIELAYRALFAVRNRFVNSVWYQKIVPVQEPFPLGEGENHLFRFAFNINCVKRLSAATS